MVKEYVQDLAALVRAILTDGTKQNVVARASQLEGGWENWLQVELACALAASNQTAYREQYVYLNTDHDGRELKSDLKILLPKSDNKHLSVELKVQSVGQDAAFTETIFNTDINKVGYLFKNDIIGACGIMVIDHEDTIEQFDNLFLGVGTEGQRGMGRLPEDKQHRLNEGHVVYWWALKVNPDTGKAIVSWDSAEVFFKWSTVRKDLFEAEIWS